MAGAARRACRGGALGSHDEPDARRGRTGRAGAFRTVGGVDRLDRSTATLVGALLTTARNPAGAAGPTWRDHALMRLSPLAILARHVRAEIGVGDLLICPIRLHRLERLIDRRHQFR